MDSSANIGFKLFKLSVFMQMLALGKNRQLQLL